MIKSVGRAEQPNLGCFLLISRLDYMIWMSNFLRFFSFFNALLLHTINPYFLTKNVLVLPFANFFWNKNPQSWTIKFRKKIMYSFLCLYNTPQCTLHLPSGFIYSRNMKRKSSTLICSSLNVFIIVIVFLQKLYTSFL